MSEIYDIKELPDGTFPLLLNLIDRYQRENYFLSEKLKRAKYKRVPFVEARIL